MRAPWLIFVLVFSPSAASACALDVAVIRQVIEDGRANVRACYERALERDAELEGRVTMRWTVAPSGAVARVEVAKQDAGMRKVSRCVAGVIKTWRFPRIPGGGTATVLYPFAFASRP